MKYVLKEEDRWVCERCGVKDCPKTDEIIELCTTDDYSSEMLAQFYEERMVQDEE